MKLCFRHPDRPSVKELNIPCAPGGKLPACAECADPANGRAVFEAYQANHRKHIKAFTQENPGS